MLTPYRRDGWVGFKDGRLAPVLATRIHNDVTGEWSPWINRRADETEEAFEARMDLAREWYRRAKEAKDPDAVLLALAQAAHKIRGDSPYH